MSLLRDGEKRNKTKVSSVALVELVDSVEFTVGEVFHDEDGEGGGGQTYVLTCRKLNAKQRGKKTWPKIRMDTKCIEGCRAAPKATRYMAKHASLHRRGY